MPPKTRNQSKKTTSPVSTTDESDDLNVEESEQSGDESRSTKKKKTEKKGEDERKKSVIAADIEQLASNPSPRKAVQLIRDNKSQSNDEDGKVAPAQQSGQVMFQRTQPKQSGESLGNVIG